MRYRNFWGSLSKKLHCICLAKVYMDTELQNFRRRYSNDARNEFTRANITSRLDF
jgi:hypothetical protein